MSEPTVRVTPHILVVPRTPGHPYRSALLRLCDHDGTDAVVLWSERRLTMAEFDSQINHLAAITGYPVVTL